MPDGTPTPGRTLLPRAPMTGVGATATEVEDLREIRAWMSKRQLPLQEVPKLVRGQAPTPCRLLRKDRLDRRCRIAVRQSCEERSLRRAASGSSRRSGTFPRYLRVALVGASVVGQRGSHPSAITAAASSGAQQGNDENEDQWRRIRPIILRTSTEGKPGLGSGNRVPLSCASIGRVLTRATGSQFLRPSRPVNGPRRSWISPSPTPPAPTGEGDASFHARPKVDP